MKKSVAIIGSGPGALMLAATLDENKFNTTIYEKNFAPARKFLVAGDGGFNLTHSENIEQFISRYSPVSFLEKSIRIFDNTALRDWFLTIGIETFIGTSKRVFSSKGIKPIDVLNAILTILKRKNITIKTLHTWKGWNSNNELLIFDQEKEITVRADITVFALGGASWSKTGSDGIWLNLFQKKGIACIAFQPSNCAFAVDWDESFISKIEGLPLKNISIRCDGYEKTGEVILTKFGIEGGAVYALSSLIRNQLRENTRALVFIDLKPSLSISEIHTKFVTSKRISFTTFLKDDLKLSKTAISLLKNRLTKEEFMNVSQLISKIKQLPLQLTGMAPMDEAISTVGGVALDELDENFQLKKLPHHYAIGEMLDWDAPTGGYLLQACFSMGYYLGHKLNNELNTVPHESNTV